METLELEGQKVFFKSSEEMNEKEVNNKVSFILTSPPYWDLKDYGHDKEIGKESYQEYIERMNLVWSACHRLSNENAILCIVINDRRKKGVLYPIPMDIVHQMKEWKFIDYLIWFTPNAMTQNGVYKNKMYDKKTEMMLIFAKNHEYQHTFNKIRVKQKYWGIDPRLHNKDALGRGLPNIIRCAAHKTPKIREKNYHMAAFPDRLVYALLHTYTNKGDHVLDPFLGSGTVLKLARHMGRYGYGYEINANYKQTIKNRILEPFFAPKWEELDIFHDPEKISSVNTNKQRADSDKSLGNFLKK